MRLKDFTPYIDEVEKAREDIEATRRATLHAVMRATPQKRLGFFERVSLFREFSHLYEKRRTHDFATTLLADLDSILSCARSIEGRLSSISGPLKLTEYIAELQDVCRTGVRISDDLNDFFQLFVHNRASHYATCVDALIAKIKRLAVDLSENGIPDHLKSPEAYGLTDSLGVTFNVGDFVAYSSQSHAGFPHGVLEVVSIDVPSQTFVGLRSHDHPDGSRKMTNLKAGYAITLRSPKMAA